MIYEKILLPISGKYEGERSAKALEHALKLVNGEIIVMHSYGCLPKIIGGEGHTELVRKATAKAMQIVTPMVTEIQKMGMPCRARVVEGAPEDTIVHVAHEEKCDIIVMFTDGRNGLSDMLLGSITERVLRATDIPLLAIRR